MNQEKKKKSPFKKCETGYHKHAKMELAQWTEGVMEQPFYIEDSIAFIPDVVTYKNGVIDSIYEVVYKHPINGRKLGMIHDWCYRNATEVSVFEVSADFILAQTEKPERIITMEYYAVNPFNS